jgi:hypothetical protein
MQNGRRWSCEGDALKGTRVAGAAQRISCGVKLGQRCWACRAATFQRGFSGVATGPRRRECVRGRTETYTSGAAAPPRQERACGCSSPSRCVRGRSLGTHSETTPRRASVGDLRGQARRHSTRVARSSRECMPRGSSEQRATRAAGSARRAARAQCSTTSTCNAVESIGTAALAAYCRNCSSRC